MAQMQESSAAHTREAEPNDPSQSPLAKPVRRRPRFLWLVLFVCFALLVVIGTNITNYLLFTQQPAATAVAYHGPFVMPPLSQDQINALVHLPERLQAKQLAQLYVSQMTLDEKLGQLFMAQALTYNDSANTPDSMYMINQLHAGGVIMYAIQMNTLAQTKGDIQHMQQQAAIPLLISADEEGGYVERVQKIFGDRPGALATYQTGDVNKATQLGQSITHDLRILGINTDLAPDVDVQQVDGPDQYLRTWGYTPQSVITYGGAYLRAVQGNGEIAALKHFPGLGAATTDAHTSLPVITSSKAHIYATDLAPYQALLSSPDPLNDPGMIMTTDLMMPALDPKLPAELSPTIITGILRNQLHYDGVVITDALWMDGIAQKWNLVQASIMALNAGCDMLLGAIGSGQMLMVLKGLKAALADGQLSIDRVNQAVTRIIALKYQYHLLPTPQY
ncbi:MAG: glycoside hydrolase family 3 N-terminal domain-containing protein [Ktedonobacteraceae bacterium]